MLHMVCSGTYHSELPKGGAQMKICQSALGGFPCSNRWGWDGAVHPTHFALQMLFHFIITIIPLRIHIIFIIIIPILHRAQESSRGPHS